MALAVDELLAIGSAREAALSPSGDAIAFVVSTVEGEREIARIHLVALDDGVEGEPITSFEGRAPSWSPHGSMLAYLAPAGERAELRLWRPGEPPADALASFAAVVGRPRVSPRHRVALSSRTESGRSALAVVSPDGSIEAVEAGPGEELVAPGWSPDGETVAFGHAYPGADGVGPTSAIEVWRPGEDPLPIETGLAYATCPSFSPDGATIALVGVSEPRLGAADPGLRPWLVPTSGGPARPAGPGPENVVLEPAPSGPLWSVGGDAIHLRLARAGRIELARIDLATAAVTVLLAGRQVVDFSLAGGLAACSVLASDDPGSIQLVGDGGDPRRIEASVGEWASRRAAEIRVPDHRAFRRADGRRLDGWVAGIDPGLGPQPTLLAFHGGPHGYFGPAFARGHFYRDVLASRGWVVVCVNSTGSGSYGAEFADGLRGRWGERDLPEQLGALDRLVAEGIADPDRLAVAGYSYGGYLAAWAITQDDRFAAAVIGAPITDLESFERTSDIGSWYTPWQMKGSLPDNRERYRRLSPATHADAAATPTLILHGEVDARVPFAQGELLRDRLAAAGRAPVELVAYPDTGHLFYSSGRPAQRFDFNRRVFEFLEANVDRGSKRA